MALVILAIALYIVAGLAAAGCVVFLIATFRVADKDDWSAMFLGLAFVVGFALVFLFSLSGALVLS